MDKSSRQHMTAPSTTNSKLPEPGAFSATSSPGEIDSRFDQLMLVKNTLQIGATPTLVAGIAMLIAQMQAQIEHPELALTVSSGIGSLVRAASSNRESCGITI